MVGQSLGGPSDPKCCREVLPRLRQPRPHNRCNPKFTTATCVELRNLSENHQRKCESQRKNVNIRKKLLNLRKKTSESQKKTSESQKNLKKENYEYQKNQKNKIMNFRKIPEKKLGLAREPSFFTFTP